MRRTVPFGRPGMVRGFAWMIAGALLLLAFLPGQGVALVLTWDSSFPLITEFDPPADRTLEGSVTVVVRGDVPMTPVETPGWLVAVDERTYRTVFLWDETEVRTVRFCDAQGDTETASLVPEKIMPLDLARHALPVLHITTEPGSLWDLETGIYTWGNHDNFLQRGEEWERPAQLVYYDEADTEAFSEPIGLRINGESSRLYHQKGLRIYFDDYGLDDSITYDFFGEGPVTCERLVLRGSRYPEFALGSAVNEPLHRDLGHPGSRHRTVAVYLNNEYWGLYSLRERLDSKFVETTWDWADDDYVLIKDHEAEVGDYGVWQEFQQEFAPGGPFASHAWFQQVSSRLDLPSYIDWHLINVLGASSDNMGGKNLALLKLGGDRWHYMAWDEDILYQNGNLNADHWRFYSAGDAEEFNQFRPPVWFSGGPWSWTWDWTGMLRALMQNAEFKSLLRSRSDLLLAGPLGESALIARIDSVAAVQNPEWTNHATRWSLGTYYYSMRTGQIRSFVSAREPVVRDQLNEFLALWAQPVELTFFTGERSEDGVELLWRTEREEGCTGFRVERAAGTAGQFTTIASWPADPALTAAGGVGLTADYAFTDTAAPADQALCYRLSWLDGDSAAQVLDWVVDLAPNPAFQLRINELLARNDAQLADGFGEYDDWLEIYNPGPEPVVTGGLFLTDDLQYTAQWALPDLELPAGGFLLVWCDEDLDQGPLHASFKLSGSGETAALFSGFADGHQMIDGITFGPQAPDVSWGRQTDGGEPWVLFTEPTPGATNQPASPVPGQVPANAVRLSAPWPNPSGGTVRVRLRAGDKAARPFTLVVYDVRGRLIRHLAGGRLPAGEQGITWDRRDDGGRAVPAGTYLFRLRAGDTEIVRRAVIVH